MDDVTTDRNANIIRCQSRSPGVHLLKERVRLQRLRSNSGPMMVFPRNSSYLGGIAICQTLGDSRPRICLLPFWWSTDDLIANDVGGFSIEPRWKGLNIALRGYKVHLSFQLLFSDPTGIFPGPSSLAALDPNSRSRLLFSLTR